MPKRKARELEAAVPQIESRRSSRRKSNTSVPGAAKTKTKTQKSSKKATTAVHAKTDKKFELVGPAYFYLESLLRIFSIKSEWTFESVT